MLRRCEGNPDDRCASRPRCLAPDATGPSRSEPRPGPQVPWTAAMTAKTATGVPRVRIPLALAVALALAVVLVVAAPVAAHSDLASTDPAAGAQLTTAPSWVVLRFSGPIEPEGSAVTVTNATGQRVDADDLRTIDAGRA